MCPTRQVTPNALNEGIFGSFDSCNLLHELCFGSCQGSFRLILSTFYRVMGCVGQGRRGKGKGEGEKGVLALGGSLGWAHSQL